LLDAFEGYIYIYIYIYSIDFVYHLLFMNFSIQQSYETYAFCVHTLTGIYLFIYFFMSSNQASVVYTGYFN